MKKILSLFLLCGAILSASTVNVTFQSPGAPSGGENLEWAGPYTLSVNGNSVLAMCMDDFLTVSGSWTANVTSLASSDLSGTFLGNGGMNIYGYQISSKDVYTIEAYLFQQLLQPGADRANIQLAAWAIMNPVTLSNVFNSNNTAVQNELFEAYNNLGTFDVTGFAILSDIGGTNQEFMVGTPEPTTLALLGAGLFAIGATRFSRRKKTAE